VRLTTALASNHNLWARMTRSPTNGFINDYYGGFAAELAALTRQDQGSTSVASQYTGVFGSKWTGEVLVAHASTFLNVRPFAAGPTNGGAAIFDGNDGRWYNGSTFDGYIRRPRTQVTAAVSYFPNLRGDHTLKVQVRTGSRCSQRTRSIPYRDRIRRRGLQPVTRTYLPACVDTSMCVRSTGMQLALAATVSDQGRAIVEAGVRLEPDDQRRARADARYTRSRRVFQRITPSPATAATLLVRSCGRFLACCRASRTTSPSASTDQLRSA
jgi:hypothetical protein